MYSRDKIINERKVEISYLRHQQKERITIMPDVIFSQRETEYLGSQRLARIATAASSSSSSEGFIQPDGGSVRVRFSSRN